MSILLHRLSWIGNLALSGLDDRTIDLAGAHGDAGEADFVQAADRVDIATALTADEDFELRIDGASIFDESADHLFDGGMDGDERMTLEEFLVDVERQEAVGVVAGNGECRLGEVVGTEGSEAIDGVNVIVIAGDFGATSRDLPGTSRESPFFIHSYFRIPVAFLNLLYPAKLFLTLPTYLWMF